ncbi:MAG: hypothetical protein QMD82_07205 [bacterium]|nr:hypothetical protein [bacterium]
MFTNRIIIGLDPAWKKGRESYGVLIREDLFVKKAFSFYEFRELEEIMSMIPSETKLIFVDAPLNLETGERVRVCDREFLKRGIPILPFNEEIMKNFYSPFFGFELRKFLEDKGFKYCGSFNENSFYEVYAFGNAMLVFGIKRKLDFLKKWKKLLADFGFTGLKKIKSLHHIDALLSTLPFFVMKWNFDVFSLYRERGYCLFVPGQS